MVPVEVMPLACIASVPPMVSPVSVPKLVIFGWAAVVTVPAVVAVPAFPPIFRFATGVVEATTKGAVPVASVEVNWPLMPRVEMPERAPEEMLNPLIVPAVLAVIVEATVNVPPDVILFEEEKN